MKASVKEHWRGGRVKLLGSAPHLPGVEEQEVKCSLSLFPGTSAKGTLFCPETRREALVQKVCQGVQMLGPVPCFCHMDFTGSRVFSADGDDTGVAVSLGAAAGGEQDGAGAARHVASQGWSGKEKLCLPLVPGVCSYQLSRKLWHGSDTQLVLLQLLGRYILLIYFQNSFSTAPLVLANAALCIVCWRLSCPASWSIQIPELFLQAEQVELGLLPVQVWPSYYCISTRNTLKEVERLEVVLRCVEVHPGARS